VTHITAAIVARRYASLIELQTTYSMGDALDLYEIIAVNNYNEAAYSEAAKRDAEARRR